MKKKMKKIFLLVGALAISAMFASTALAVSDDDVSISDTYTDSSLTGNISEYTEEEYSVVIDDINKLIAEENYDAVAENVNDIQNIDLKIRVLDYLGVYYPQVYKATLNDGKITIDVRYIGSFIGKDGNGNPILSDTSVALYNTMSAYKVGLISEIVWTMTGKKDTFEASLAGNVLDSDDIEKTINGDGTVSFGLVVKGAYFEENDVPEITADVAVKELSAE